MYLDSIKSFGVDPTPVLGGAGGLVRSPALYSYDLTGTPATWKYGSCRTGYTKRASGKAHPNAYTCFASNSAPATTRPSPACPPSLTFENIKQQVISEASANAYQDHYAMQNGRNANSSETLKTLQPCPFYAQSAALYVAEYQKQIKSRPQIAYAR